MPSRSGRVLRSWLHSLRKLMPFGGGGDPFDLKSSDALKDPAVLETFQQWKEGEITSEEFKRWLDDKWEEDHS